MSCPSEELHTLIKHMHTLNFYVSSPWQQKVNIFLGKKRVGLYVWLINIIKYLSQAMDDWENEHSAAVIYLFI